MLRRLFYAVTYWAPALLILLTVIARAAAPFPCAGEDCNQPVEESLVAVSHELSDKSDLYIKVDGGDPSAHILADLNARKLPATFEPWSARSPEGDRCRTLATADTGGARVCMRDNFLSADLLSMPLWHVALVRVKTAACTAELTLVRGTQWHIISQRAACA